jgi:hypothetical protein
MKKDKENNMEIYHTSTVSFRYSARSDGLHMIHEIDDDDMGYWSVIEYVIPKESLDKLNTIIDGKDFIELCRKEDYTGMLEFLDAHEIPYYKKE